MTTIGYVRIANATEDPSVQRTALTDAGCTRLYEDFAGPGRNERPALAEALAQVKSGDVLVVWRLGRIGRSLGNLVRTVIELTNQGVALRSLTEGIDTGTDRRYSPAEIFALLARFEDDIIRERTRPGLVAAMASPRPSGRKPSITPAMLKQARALVADGFTVREAAARVGVGKTTLYAALKPDNSAAIESRAASEGSEEVNEQPAPRTLPRRR